MPFKWPRDHSMGPVHAWAIVVLESVDRNLRFWLGSLRISPYHYSRVAKRIRTGAIRIVQTSSPRSKSDYIGLPRHEWFKDNNSLVFEATHIIARQDFRCNEIDEEAACYIAEAVVRLSLAGSKEPAYVNADRRDWVRAIRKHAVSVARRVREHSERGSIHLIDDKDNDFLELRKVILKNRGPYKDEPGRLCRRR